MQQPPLSGPQGQDGDRIKFTRQSRRLLYGEYEQDLRERLTLMISNVRKDAWGILDMGSNPYRSMWGYLATLYTRPPTVETADTAGEELALRLSATGYWALMSRVQRDTLALRQNWVFVDVVPRPGAKGKEHDIVTEPVPPDMVVPEADPSQPSRPIRIWRAVRRKLQGHVELKWCWDEYDVRNAESPGYRVHLPAEEGLVDVTVLAGLDGTWPDRWRDDDSRPFLPAVLYHAERTPYLHDPYAVRELVEGTLNLGVLRTFLLHCTRSATWAQRFALNAVIQGMSAAGEPGASRSEVVSDPATVLFLDQPDEAKSANIGSWDIPVDLMSMIAVLEYYVRTMMVEAGVNPADIERSGDGRSGLALTVNRDSQRESQRRYEPQFRPADQRMHELCAMMLNVAESRSYPVAGYRVVHQGIPQSAAERAAQRVHLLELVEVGLLGPVDAYRALNPGTDDSAAMAALLRIRDQRALLQPGLVTDQPGEQDDTTPKTEVSNNGPV